MPKGDKGGKSGKKKSKKQVYRKCLGQCYPKKVCPPDYSNIDDEADWQMSPFSNERFDLDEIQKLEKKGVKAKKELEALKRKLAGLEEEPGESCSSGMEMRPQAIMRPRAMPAPSFLPRTEPQMTCTPEILYQPYGPLITPVRSYARPFNASNTAYCYLGPSYFSAYRFKVPAPGMVSPTPCPDTAPSAPPMPNDLAFYSAYQASYTPLGP